ncbi:transcription initiation factor IIB-like [Prunus dulcis]|nr:transcription initiation factor IIB-like [Prunus dulcis]
MQKAMQKTKRKEDWDKGFCNDNGFCSDCKTYTDVVLDHRSGDTICTQCGLILEDHAVDFTAEWRNFDDQDSNNDPSRVGARSDPLLDSGVLTVNISNDNKKAASCVLPRLHKTLRNPDKSLHIAFETLGMMADRLALVTAIRDHAKELYKKADDRKFCRGRNCDAIMAACLFLACQEKGLPRTLKEIAMVANGATRKEINRMKELLKKILEVDSKTTNVGDLSRRCCSMIGMANQDMKAVLETLNKSKEVDVRRSPKSVLAAVMYMIAQLSNDKSTRDLTLHDVSQAADVAVATTKKAYKDLYPYVSRIIPNWFVKLEDLKILCLP